MVQQFNPTSSTEDHERAAPGMGGTGAARVLMARGGQVDMLCSGGLDGACRGAVPKNISPLQTVSALINASDRPKSRFDQTHLFQLQKHLMRAVVDIDVFGVHHQFGGRRGLIGV
jgi:hypothetical protein